MNKIKLFIILSLGLISLSYNIGSGDLVSFLKEANNSELIYNHLGINGNDSYIGIIFDYLISILFNINIKDLISYFKFFGG